MTVQEAVEFITGTHGRFFSVEFVKRTDKSVRQMSCRTGVTRHLKGGEKAYDAQKHNLITVFDMQKQGYRSIPIENILRIKINGEWVSITEEKHE